MARAGSARHGEAGVAWRDLAGHGEAGLGRARRGWGRHGWARRARRFAGETKVKHVCRIVWQLADADPDTGKRPIVQKRYTVSLHEKAALRHDLESWRSRPFTEQELAGFDVEKVIGVPAFLNIVHAHKDGSTYANVMAVMPPPKGTSVPPVTDYVRVCDRQPEPGADDQGDTATEITDDDVPF